MPLRQRRVIGPQHERQVGEARRRPPERLVNQHLPRRVRDVVLTADHLRDPHQRIVDDDGKVVGGRAIRAHEHRVADDLGRTTTRPRTASSKATSRWSGTRKRTTADSPAATRAAACCGIDRAAASRVAAAAGPRPPQPADRHRAAPACRSSSRRGRSRAARRRATDRSRAARTAGTGHAPPSRSGPRPSPARASASRRRSRARIRAWIVPDRCPRCAARTSHAARARAAS